MEDNKLTKKQKVLAYALTFVLVVLIVLKFVFKDEEKKQLDIVTSSSKFYTVSSCVNRYIDFVYNEDSEKILEVLDSKYKTKNNLNKNNLFDKLDRLDKEYDFEARKMYQEKINDDVMAYYVKGYLIENIMSNNLVNEKKDFYIIVYLDSKNSTYSVVPYDGEVFIEEEQNEKK